MKRIVIGVAAMAVVLGGTLTATNAWAAEMTVYKSPYCGCCGNWIDHMRENGHKVTVRETEDMDRIKRLAGVPENMDSCHTAMVEGYVLEGHVPASDLERFLAEKPKVRGIAVPGMPMGSPGMETPDNDREPYSVVTFDSNGSYKLFNRYK